MKILRRLQAMSDPLTTAPTAETPIAPAAWMPAPEHPEIWAAFTAIGNSNGVIDHTTTGVPVPSEPTGEN